MKQRKKEQIGETGKDVIWKGRDAVKFKISHILYLQRDEKLAMKAIKFVRLENKPYGMKVN